MDPLHRPKADDSVVFEGCLHVEEVFVEEADVLWKLFFDLEVLGYYL